jgi:hypothetical protein
MTNAATTNEIAAKISRTRTNWSATSTALLARSRRCWSPVTTVAPCPSAFVTSAAKRDCGTPALAIATISSYPVTPVSAPIAADGRPTTVDPLNSFEAPKSSRPTTVYGWRWPCASTTATASPTA